MNVSVGDFAEQLLAQDSKGGGLKPPTFSPEQSHYSPVVGEQAPDISNVTVPNDFVAGIVEGKAPPVPLVEEVASTPQTVSEDTELKTLIHELKTLLIEVKQTLNEMTAAGSIGVNMGGSKKKKDEDEDPMEALLKKVRKKRSSK